MLETPYNAITARKAMRSYSNQPLTDEERIQIEEAIGALLSLEGRPVTFRLKRRDEIGPYMTKPNVNAPYYLIVSAPEGKGWLENAGFMGEQLVLRLTQMGLGTVWLGGAAGKRRAPLEGERYCIAIGLGHPAQALRSSASEWNRKPLADYCLAPPATAVLEQLAQAGRLAPSGMNWQPVRFLPVDDVFHVYRKRPVIRMKIDSMQRIDAGISLCHIYEAAKALDLRPEAAILPDAPTQNGMIYAGSVRLHL